MEMTKKVAMAIYKIDPNQGSNGELLKELERSKISSSSDKFWAILL